MTVFDDLDAATVSILGDEITYTPAGGSAATLTAFVDYSPDTIDFGSVSGVTLEASVQVRKIDIPIPDRVQDRFVLPKTGLTYKIASPPLHSKCGAFWNIALVKVNI